MILPFSTKINNKPTYFVERIHSGLIQNNLVNNFALTDGGDFSILMLATCEPKIHTIREDKTDRWKPGTIIDFFINVRQKNMFRFAPKLPVVSTQKIEIRYIPLTIPRGKMCPCVWVDGKIKYDMAGALADEFLHFAQNDGFDTIDDFFDYFNADFKGKLIHWTNKRY